MPLPGPSDRRPTSPRIPILAALALAVGVGPGIAEGQEARPRQAPPGFGTPESRPGFVDRTRPSLPEGLAMVVEILSGGRFAPGRGWFERAVSRSRFGWDWVEVKYDRDRDGRVVRGEFPGLDGDFRRLDHDRDGKLTRLDFAFPGNAVARSRSKMIMSFADRNKDGRIAAAEYTQMIFMAGRDNFTRVRYFAEALDDVIAAYKANERAGLPFLTLGDLRETVDLRADLDALERIPDPNGDVEAASRSTLLKALIRRDLGSLQAGPAPGGTAPDFALSDVDGRGQVSLAKLLGAKPVVLCFGSLSEPSFRNDAGTLEKLARSYRGRAEFLMVAVRQARPSDGWPSKDNAQAGASLAQPKDEKGRFQAARDLKAKLGLTWPMAVDRMDDRVGILYSGMPCRLYLVDPSGRVAYQGGRGPFGFKPDELEQALLLQLQETPPPADDRGRKP